MAEQGGENEGGGLSRSACHGQHDTGHDCREGVGQNHTGDRLKARGTEPVGRLAVGALDAHERLLGCKKNRWQHKDCQSQSARIRRKCACRHDNHRKSENTADDGWNAGEELRYETNSLGEARSGGVFIDEDRREDAGWSRDGEADTNHDKCPENGIAETSAGHARRRWQFGKNSRSKQRQAFFQKKKNNRNQWHHRQE